MSIELLSIHIPKTAGTSFRQSLYSEYGENAILRLDYKPHAHVLLANEILHNPGSSFPTHTKVIHGHFLYADLVQQYPDFKSLPLITWLRHPVDRVVSNYFYLAERLKEMLMDKPYSNLLGKMQRTLLEYASDPINRNRISWFLQNTKPEDYQFIGFTENYESDFIELAKSLKWNKAQPNYVNKTKEKNAVIDTDILKQIEELNAEDMNWYENALRFRKCNLSKI